MELLAWGNTVMEPHLFSRCRRLGAETPTHEGEEFLYILQGELAITGAGKAIPAKGRQFYFESATPHRWKNPGRGMLDFVGEYAADVLAKVTAAYRKAGVMNWRQLAAVFSADNFGCVIRSCAKTPTLNLLVWGYADPSFLQARTTSLQDFRFIHGSSDELMAKLRGGALSYDVISPSSDIATSIAQAGLAAPLDLSKIQLPTAFSAAHFPAPDAQKGQVYGVPFVWGPDPMIYDTAVFSAAAG